MATWLTADTHFNHTNICGPSMSNWKRGYRNFESLEQMNDTIIDNINMMVKPDDTLWHLGDFAFGDKQLIPELRARINCRSIHLLIGNHDRRLLQLGFDNCFMSVHKHYEMRVHRTLVVFNHFPLAVWNENGAGSVHFFGHCHGSYQPLGRCVDIGLDNQLMLPVELYSAIETLLKQDIFAPDHHDSETNYG